MREFYFGFFIGILTACVFTLAIVGIVAAFHHHVDYWSAALLALALLIVGFVVFDMTDLH